MTGLFFLPGLVSFFCFILLYSLLLNWFSKAGLSSKGIDGPDRWNLSQKPVLGGIGFFAAFCAGWFYEHYPHVGLTGSDWLLFGGGVLAFGTGLYDDLFRLSPGKKIVGQLLAALLLVASGGCDLLEVEWLDVVVKIVFIVGMMNSINMLDNMDGVAAISALAVFLWFMIGSDSLPAMLMSACLLAFLAFNRHPSIIFMGDSGSLLLGYFGASLFLRSGIAGEPAVAGVYLTIPVTVLSLFAIPLADSLVVTINRIRHRISPMKGGRDHTTHNLVYLGFSEKGVTWLFVFLASVEVVVAWYFRSRRDLYPEEIPEMQIIWPSILFFCSVFFVHFLISLHNLRRGRYSYSH